MAMEVDEGGVVRAVAAGGTGNEGGAVWVGAEAEAAWVVLLVVARAAMATVAGAAAAVRTTGGIPPALRSSGSARPCPIGTESHTLLWRHRSRP